MAKLFSIKPSITIKGRKFKGIRGWAGKPTHPPLTDLPIAAYVLAAAFDVVSFIAWKMKGADSTIASDAFIAATWAMVGGAVASLGAVFTGFWDWWKGLDRDRTNGLIGKASHTQVWRTANWHMTVMLTVTAIVILDIVIRIGQYDKHYATLITTILSVLAGVLVSYGATYGGSLVFDYQFNVEGLKGSTAWNESEEDQLPGHKS